MASDPRVRVGVVIVGDVARTKVVPVPVEVVLSVAMGPAQLKYIGPTPQLIVVVEVLAPPLFVVRSDAAVTVGLVDGPVSVMFVPEFSPVTPVPAGVPNAPSALRNVVVPPGSLGSSPCADVLELRAVISVVADHVSSGGLLSLP